MAEPCLVSVSNGGNHVAFWHDCPNKRDDLDCLVSDDKEEGVRDIFVHGLDPDDTDRDDSLTGDGDVLDTVLQVFDVNDGGLPTPLCPAEAVAVA